MGKKLEEFYKGKRILITGHTGFKGSWMCSILKNVGADVFGYALEPTTTPALYNICSLSDNIKSYIGDIRDIDMMQRVFSEVKPDIVIHMAAQPIVRESYKNPVDTYETNVMGTVNVLECVRNTQSVRSFLNVTTDKVYKNREWEWGYRENEELNGFDPYSNSKSCSELVTSAYKNSFFSDSDRSVAISTARAGNVIGGGDFAPDRIIPDCFRAAERNEDIIVRNPYSVRPYQHVLEPVMAYLMIAARQYEDLSLAGNYNVGPEEGDCLTTGELVDCFCKNWNRMSGSHIKWVNKSENGPHEAGYLRLDCSKIKHVFDWSPRWNVNKAVEMTVAWYIAFLNKDKMDNIISQQISMYN